MKTLLKLAVAGVLIAMGTCLSAQTWTTIVTDPANDGADPTLLDGTELAFYYDKTSDSLFFKVTVSGFTTTTQQAIGVNIMINIPGGGATFNFWGNHNQNAYHKLLTTWVTGSPPSAYSGTVGIADAAGISALDYTSLSSNNIAIEAKVATNELILGLKRSDFITDADMGGDMITVKTAAAVGSNTVWNDDIFTGSGDMTIDKSVSTGIHNTVANTSQLAVFPNPADGEVRVRYHSYEPTQFQVNVRDVTGKAVLYEQINNLTRGEHLLNLDVTALDPGMYFVELRGNSESQVVPLVIQ